MEARVMHKTNSVHLGQDKRGTSKFVTIHASFPSYRTPLV
jgi:hypothetical protein